MKLYPRIDLKSYLLFSSKSFLRILRLSPKQFFLPGLIVYPSNVCNFKCMMCDSGADSVKTVQRMELSTLEKVLKECASFILKPRIHFSGLGEPLVYPDIIALMQLCKRYKANWSMTTNGYLLEKYAESLVENGCRAINISIHGIGPEHDRVTGISNSFNKVMSGLEKLAATKGNHNAALPLIAVNCVITNENAANLKSVLDRFIDLPVNSITFQHLIFSRDDFLGKESFVIREKEKTGSIREFMAYVDRNKFQRKINFFPKIRRGDLAGYYSAADNAFGHSCILPWLGARIYPDGAVGMCNNVYGNILSSSLKSIINSDEAILFRGKLIKNIFRSPMCFRCCHRHYY